MSSNVESDNDVSQAATSSGRKKKEYSVKFKLQVVDWAKLNRNNNGEPNKRAAARHFGVTPKNVRRWLLQAGHLQVRKMRKGGNQAKNLPGGDHQTTAAGNPKPPPPEVYLQWVLDAWESVKTDVIVRSFKACGIFNKLDGSEDSLIHCLQEGNGMPDGLHLLAQGRQEAQTQDLPQLMQGLEVEAPEDPEDDAGNDSDASVISAEEQDVEESDDGECVEEDNSEYDFLG